MQFGFTGISKHHKTRGDDWESLITELKKSPRIYIPRRRWNTTSVIYYLLTGNNVGKKEQNKQTWNEPPAHVQRHSSSFLSKLFILIQVLDILHASQLQKDYAECSLTSEPLSDPEDLDFPSAPSSPSQSPSLVLPWSFEQHSRSSPWGHPHSETQQIHESCHR